MKKLFLFAVLISILPLSSGAYQKGMALGLYAKDPHYSYEEDLKGIKALGVDHVSLIISWYQKNISSTDIYPHWKPIGDFDTTPDIKLTEVIRQAHGMGLKVFLFPILRIEERKDKEWRGNITPQNTEEWLQSYTRFTLHYAHIASRYGVELFSVGSELCSVEPELVFWKNLIKKIRTFYPGQLIYSANWDHYKKIGFWEDLDYLGLNGYYELAKNSTPTLQELTLKWWDIENEISAWQEQNRKSIIFTEIGYPSIDGACSKPWDYTRVSPIDLEEQALCYEAFFLSWGRSQKLAGVYFWNWYGEGGTTDRGYTPRGKPAEKVIAKWFKNLFLPNSGFVSSSSQAPQVSGGSSAPAGRPLPPVISQQDHSPLF